MVRYYNKNELKGKLELEQVYDLLDKWGGEPEYSNSGLTSQTICHNIPGAGSRKLYYYENTHLFKCYTGCPEPSFDIFELCIKVMQQQHNLCWELYDAMDCIANYFGFEGIEKIEDEQPLIKDWDIIKRHKIQQTYVKESPLLKSYDPIILTRFSYPVIFDWEQEGILPNVIKENFIGYYAGGNQITIPHFDINNRLIGIRGRSLCTEDAERWGKYRPLLIGKEMYSHPLSMNLYHLNRTKENIKKSKIAIIFESEKSTLLYESYYGKDNDISVACCGSSISSYQIQLLKDLGCREVIVAFDRDYDFIGDDIFKRIKSKLIHLYNKYNNTIKVSAIFDKELILPKKASPIDVSKEVFEDLLSRRIIPKG